MKPRNLLQDTSAIHGQRAKRYGRNHGLVAFSGRANIGSTVVEHCRDLNVLWCGRNVYIRGERLSENFVNLRGR